MHTFFFLKKLVETLVMPFQFAVLLIILGVILLWLKRAQRSAKYLLTSGLGLLLIFSNSSIGYHLVHSLEAEYPPLQLTQPGKDRFSAGQQAPPVDKTNPENRVRALGADPVIVVLSGGASNDPELPETDRLTSDSALRVAEAVQIYRSLTSSSRVARKTRESIDPGKNVPVESPEVILSGGPTMNSMPEALPMEKLAETLGIRAKAIRLEIDSDDTYTEAKNVLPMVGHKPFILVTSAYHMPRSVELFRHLGMHPIPAPANYVGRTNTEPFLIRILPKVDALEQSSTAFHERLGMIWEHLRGQL